jgi:hypothetical protein
MSCWRRMEKISWTDRVNNKAVLHRVKEERNILRTIRRSKAKWIGHILRRNFLLSHTIEGMIIGTRRRGSRRKQLLDCLKEARGYWKLQEEVQDRTLRRTQFGRGYGPVARETTTWTWYDRIIVSKPRPEHGTRVPKHVVLDSKLYVDVNGINIIWNISVFKNSWWHPHGLNSRVQQ